jgi:hypothetical protein
VQNRRGDAPHRRALEPHRKEAGADGEADGDIDQKHDREIALILPVDVVEDAQRRPSSGKVAANGAQELAPEEVARGQQEKPEKRRSELPQRDRHTAVPINSIELMSTPGPAAGSLGPRRRGARRFGEFRT